MPPLRTLPNAKPLKTERTHEENQERAYIAASRRSDRSLEARVESARRASEIHKKRTGRSLRVREEDVLNEEMYEEEDADLTSQIRRINLLNPGLLSSSLAYGGFGQRVNDYLASQLGVRNYLQQAVHQAYQFNPGTQPDASQNLSPRFSPQAMSGHFNGQLHSSWPMSAVHGNEPFASTPRQQSGHAQHLPVPIEKANSSAAEQRPVQTPQQVPSPASSASSPHSQNIPPATTLSGVAVQAEGISPLTAELPVSMQQLMDGNPQIHHGVVPPSQLTCGVSMPSMGHYSYNPNGRPRKGSYGMDTPSEYFGLDQTLTPFVAHGNESPPPMVEPRSASSAPTNLNSSFYTGFDGDFGSQLDFYRDFDIDFGSGSNTGQVTPNEQNWSGAEFFNYNAASD